MTEAPAKFDTSELTTGMMAALTHNGNSSKAASASAGERIQQSCVLERAGADQEEINNDLREAVDRIANLELALVELSQTSGSPRNVASADVLASPVRWAARRALEHPVTTLRPLHWA